MNVYLSRAHYPITTLGPGRRLGVWFQGCSIHCPGCISIDTWTFDTEPILLSELMDTILQWLVVADGVTISGGEPFDQPEALEALLKEIRSNCSGDILVYSGYSFDDLSKRHLSKLKGLIDALITEPFIVDHSQTLPLRGSDNQILHRLTPLGEQRYNLADCPSSFPNKSIDIMFDDDGTVWMAGIPQQGDLRKLEKLLLANNLQSWTSEDKRGSA